MIFSLITTLAIGSLASASQAHVQRDSVPAVWDGQYTHPTPENGGVEWKYFQLTADTVGNKAPATFSVLFYQGYGLQFGPRDPTLPQYYLSVTGSFPNGTTFSLTVPAESANITAHGQAVTGTWGSVARFTSSNDLKTYHATFTAPKFGLEGSFNINSRGSHHLSCNTTTDTTFSSAVPADSALTPSETYVYKKIGWLTSVPGGSASAQLNILGTKLQFSGQGYHDANYASAALNTGIETWYAATGQLGPYDLTWVYAVPINSTKILTTGYIARDGVVLQNQCSLNGSKTRDTVTVTPYGVADDIVSGDKVPLGFIVQYTLTNGEHFKFNYSSINNTQVPDVVPYHRFIGKAQGGKVGGKAYSGPSIFEWLNPGLKAYTPPSSGM